MNNTTVRVAGYVRVSTADQVRGFGQDMQINALRGHVASRRAEGWLLPEDGLFVEQESGADIDRPVLESLMKQVQDGRYDVVLVWKLDRISRSLSDMISIQCQLSRYGAALASIKESLDFSSPSGRLVFHIFGALAEFERETIQMRTLEGKRASALSGNYIGGYAPYGYRKIPSPTGRGSRLQIEEKDARWVRQIFTWYTRDGLTFTQIASRLNDLAVPKSEHVPQNCQGPRWYDTSVRHVLTREIYAGRYVTNRFVHHRDGSRSVRPEGEWIVSQVDPIIAQSVFERAQERLHHGSDARGGGKQSYLLARKLVDASTGKHLAGYRSAKGTLNYRRAKFTSREGTVYSGLSIAAHLVDDFTWRSLRDALHEPDTFLAMLEARDNDTHREAELADELASLRSALGEAKQRCERVEEDYYNGRLSPKRRDRLMARFQAAEREAGRLVVEAEARMNASSKERAESQLRTAAAENGLSLDGLGHEERKRLVQMFVDRVEIQQTENERIASCYLRFDRRGSDSDGSSCRTRKGLQEGESDTSTLVSAGNGETMRFGYQGCPPCRTDASLDNGIPVDSQPEDGALRSGYQPPSLHPYYFTTSTVIASKNPNTDRWQPVRYAPPRWSSHARLKMRPYHAQRVRRTIRRLTRTEE